MDAKYVLCRWEERLWPAKVLSKTETSTKNKRKKEFFLDVQILSLEEKIQVRSSAVEALHKSHIESIAALLASQDEVPAAALQELTYRRSLRVALDVLNEDSHPGGEGTSPWQGDKPPRADPASRAPDAPPPRVLPAQPAARPGLERRPGPVAQSLQSLQAPTDRAPPGQVDLEQGPPKSGDPSLPSLLPAGAGFMEGGGSRPSHGHETPAVKRPWHSAESAEPGRAGLESLGQGDSPCAGPGGRDPPETPSSRAHSAKKPRLDGGQSPPVTPNAGTASGSGEPRLPPMGSPSPRPPERLEEDPLFSSSEESAEFNSISSLLEEEEEEEPPRILLYHEPRSFEVGMLVWLKYQKYPFWPAVVKSVRRRDKKASVLFIEGNMNPKGRGITVSLRRLKHFDCADKHALLDRAKEDYAQAIGWCVSLITDYRVRLGCGSFAGSFLEYYAADISYPVRKSIQQDVLGTRFPQLGQEDPTEPVAHSPPGRPQPCRKVLPDRSRAARDRANQRLVEFIVNARGAESHLHAVLQRGRPSRWLRTFLRSGQHVTCVETYLEDDAQLDAVVKYLQGVCQDAGGGVPAQGGGDRIRFILDVLLPEAIICAISAVDAVDYKTAEQKYIQGPTLSYREKEIFDKELLEERNRRRW